MDNVSVKRLSRLLTGVLASLLGLAIYLDQVKWALATPVIPWGTCDAAKHCTVILQVAESNCDAFWDLNIQVPKNSNCEALVDDYLHCLHKYCSGFNHDISLP